MTQDASLDNVCAALSALTPSGCASTVVGVNELALSQLSEAERLLTHTWAAGRRQEFAAGRQAARMALAQLEISAESLLRDAEGLPLWPDGCIGSISHCQGICMAVVSRSQGDLLLGLDVERVDRLSSAAMQRVQHREEAAWVDQDQTRASLLFSLKEAFYKLQYPRWRTPGNFQHLALNPDLEQGTANILTMDARFVPELRRVCFGFRLVDRYVVSLCWMNGVTVSNLPSD
jgi:4'-phosphopantetheinyl transferase EntD